MALAAACVLLLPAALGAADPPDVTLSATALSFPAQDVGSKADAQAVQLTNTGSAPLVISTFRFAGADPGDFAQGSDCPIDPDAIAVGASCTIYFSFTPQDVGPRTATFAIGDSAASSPQTIDLSGSGIASPQVAFAPAAVDFGGVQVGDQSAAQTVSVTNTGSATLNLSAIRLTGTDAASFTDTTTCDVQNGLAAGASCTVAVAFAPQSAGAKSASLALDDNAAGSTQTVPLTGTATPGPAPSADLAPSSLDFGMQTAGTTSAAQTVTLTDDGGAPLAVSSVAVTGDFAQTNNCPASLAAGASCEISVTFAPDVVAARAGTLVVTDNAASSPQSIGLTGRGVAAGTYLADDFESGTLSQWSQISSGADSSVAIDSTVAHGGSNSVRFTNGSDGDASTLFADLAGGGHAQSYTDFCFRIADGASGGEIANGRAVNAEYPLGIRRFVIDYNAATKGLEAYFFNDNLDRLDMYAATGQVVTGRWYCAELYMDEQLAGTATLWLDGQQVGSVSGDLSTPSPYSRLQLWNQPDAGTVWFDDVRVAATSDIGSGGGGSGGGLTIAPASLDFGAVDTGASSAAQTVTITNTGSAAAPVGGVSVGGTNAADFTATSSCPATLDAAASCTVSVVFAPGATGSRSATLSLEGTSQSVSLTGAGIVAGTYLSDDFESGSLAAWSQTSTSGSAIALDSTVANSGTQSVRLTNNSDGESSTLYQDLAGGGHATTYTRWCFEIAPGVSAGIEIANGRAVTAAEPLGARRFEIDYNPATNGLEGYFFNEQLQRLDLYAATGKVLTGRWYCAELYLDESVDGHAQLWLDGVPAGSVDGDLSAADPYSRLQLWNQPSAGTVWFDDVKVADSHIGPVGAGTAALPGAQTQLSPSSVDFGSQTVQTTSTPARSVQLTNTGTAPLTISNVAVTGDNAADFAISSDNCPPAPATLGAGASCTVEVTFTPHASGARDATLAVTDDSYYLPHTLPLAGTGVTPAAGAATLSTGSVDFGNQGLGVTSSPQPVTLTNTGTAPLTISTMSLVNSEFGMTSTCPTGGASLAVGASCEIDATFTPSAMGLQTASIDVSSDAVNGTVEIALSGSGVLPPGTFLSESFDPEANVWSSTSNTTVPSVQAGAGRNGTAGLVVPDSVAAYTTLQPGVTAETHTRFCFDVSTLWAGPLVQGRDANGFHLWEVDLDGPAQGLDVYVWDASGARLDAYIAHVVAAGQWNCADVDLAQAAAGHLDVTLNGTTIVATPADFSGSALSRLYLWGPATFDDVSVASS